MYLQTEKLVDYLGKWKCNRNTFFECILDLSRGMAQQGFWLDEEVGSIKNWLDDLTTIGYEEPIMTVKDGGWEQKALYSFPSQFTVEPIDENRIMKVPMLDYYPVRYMPSLQTTFDINNAYGEIEVAYDQMTSLNFLKSFCVESNANLKFSTNFIQHHHKHSEITLLVTFNWPAKFENILIIKHLYSSHFKNIVFCGPNILRFYEDIRTKFKRFDSFTFIEVDTVGGMYHYYCMTKAIELNMITKGYLLMSDDVLLKYWQLKEFDIEKLWFTSKLECDLFEMKSSFITKDYGNWYKPWGFKALQNVWKHFETSLSNRQIIERFFENTKSNSKSKTTLNVCANRFADIFYVPKAKFEEYHYLSGVFRRYGVILETGVGIILAGMEKHENVQLIEGTYKCCGKFGMNLYETMGVYGHAAKLTKYVKSDEGKKFCEMFVQEKIKYDEEMDQKI